MDEPQFSSRPMARDAEGRIWEKRSEYMWTWSSGSGEFSAPWSFLVAVVGPMSPVDPEEAP